MAGRSATRRKSRESVRAEFVEVMFRRHYAGLLRLAVVMVGAARLERIGATPYPVDPEVTKEDNRRDGLRRTGGPYARRVAILSISSPDGACI